MYSFVEGSWRIVHLDKDILMGRNSLDSCQIVGLVSLVVMLWFVVGFGLIRLGVMMVVVVETYLGIPV